MARWAVVAACVCLGVASLGAQQKTSPEPEGSQLGFYIGKWNEEGQSRATPTAAFGRITGQETCAWFSGGPSVVCRETTQDQAGENDSIFILGYDSGRKLYTVHGTDNTGTIYSGTGAVDQGVWKWTVESRTNGVATPMRYTFRPAPGGARTMDVESAAGKGTWAKIVSVTYKLTKQ